MKLDPRINAADIEKISQLLRQCGKNLVVNQNNSDWREVLEEKSFKTRADLLTNAEIQNGLAEITPEISFFSEEIPHTIDDRPELFWLADPIDGTASWYNGFDGYVNQLALIYKQEAILSLIYWPAKDILWFANIHDGAYQNGVEIVVPRQEDIMVVDNYPEPRGIAMKVMDRLTNAKYMESGSLSLKSMLALTGVASLFVKDVTIRDWDIAPALVFQRCLSGSIKDLHGRDLNIGDSIEYKDGLIVGSDSELVTSALDLLCSIGGQRNV